MDLRLWMHELLGVQGWKTPVGRKEARVETLERFHLYSAREYDRKHCKIFPRHPAHPSHPKSSYTCFKYSNKHNPCKANKPGRSQTAEGGRS